MVSIKICADLCRVLLGSERCAILSGFQSCQFFVAFIGEEEFRDSMATPNGNLSADGHHVGKVVQIIGPVLDVEFEGDYLPPIYQALRVVSEGFDVPTEIDVIAEVQQHLGEGRVRTVSMTPTDGMVRGMKAIDTGGPITMPVGEGTLGRVLNVIGEPVDTLGPVKH
jgi:flagellar biosynthesis/type III secretory pathway ATPase